MKLFDFNNPKRIISLVLTANLAIESGEASLATIEDDGTITSLEMKIVKKPKGPNGYIPTKIYKDEIDRMPEIDEDM